MAANVVRIANRSLVAALALCAVSALPAAAQQVDTFDTSQAAVSDPPGGASTVATGGADILGQNRGLSVRRWSGAGPVTAQVAGGALTVSVAGTTPDSRGEAVVTWDGDTNPLMLSPTGLGGVNLTSTGQAFRLTVASATAGVELAFTVYTDAGNASVSGLILPAIAAPTDIDVAFASFVTLAGTGADFASVGAITLAVRGTEEMLVLNGIQVVPATANVAATLTDNTTSAQPGETLNYTATVSNTGPGTATAPNFNDPLDAATTLVPGSVEVSPVAIDDQYAGATVGTDFSVGAPGVLINDVDGDGDALVVAPTGARPTAQGGSATVNADGSFTYTPPVLFQGLDTFPYQADDGNGIPGPGVATIHVGCAAITVSPTTLDPGAVGAPYGPVTFTATGANGAVTWSVVGMLPAGMNFSAAGVLDGTPTAGGSFPLTFVATDAAGCTGSQAITLGINTAPAITSANATTFTVGTFGTFTVTTTGFPTPSIAIGGAALPGGVAFVDNGDGTGTLSGTPDPGTGGLYALTFTATNVVGSSPALSFTLTVNQAPAITSANATTFTVGTFGTFTVMTSGFPAPSIARGGVALPGGVTFVDNGNGTGTLSGTPAAGTGATYVITFTATNVVASSPQQSFTLTVNQAPAITSANNATFAPGLAGQTFTVTTTGFPRNPGMTITRTGTLPSGVTFTDNTDGTATIAGTPAAGTQSGSPYLWTITASNGVPPDAVQNPFTFNVVCPVITVSGTIPALTFNTAMATATFTRTGGNGTITWSATGLPTGLSINSANGQVTGTPTVTGTFDVVVTATDAGACTGTRSITVTVAPVANADTYNGGVDNTQYVITGGTTGTPGTPSVQNATRIVANDLPTGFVTATAGTFATGQGGSVTIAADGTYLYTPPLRSGLAAITSDTFSYTVQSNTGGGAAVTSAPATVTINLVGRVWYVLNNGAAGNGQSQSPLQTLAAAQTASTANDHIFIYTGSGTTTNQNSGIVLKAGQRLIGQGVALVVNGNTLVAAGANPLIGNSAGAAVTLADGNTISGLTISNPSGVGITGANVNTLTVSTGVIITGAGGGAFSLSGGNGAVDFGAAVTSAAGRAVSIVSRTGGTVTVSGAITAPGGTGILLNVNSGTSSFTFSGGITLNGASSTFTATNSGTLTITGTNTIGATTPPTDTALNVANTTVGASGLTFRSISANGAPNGIILNATGATGGFTVTGDGSITRNGSGGTITNTTNDCVRLTTANSVVLRSMNLINCGNTPAATQAEATSTAAETAVEMSGGSNLILSAVLIQNPIATGLLVLDTTGTNRVNADSLITLVNQPLSHAIWVYNNNVNMALFEFTASRITNNLSAGATFFVANGGSANMQLDVTNSTFDDLSNQALTAAAGGVVTATGTLTSNILNNVFQNAKGVNENNLGVLVNNGAQHVAIVQGNTFNNVAEDGTIANTSIIRTQNSGGRMTATVRNNTVQNIAYTVGGRHVIGHVFEPVAYNATDFSNLRIEGNTASNVTYTATNREFIFIDYRPTASNGNVRILGNNFNMPTAGTQQAIELRFRQTNASTVNVQVNDNGNGTGAVFNTGVGFLDIDAETAATVNATVTNNRFSNTNGAPGTTIDLATETATSTACANFSANHLNHGAGTDNGTINLNETAGAMNVTQASAAAMAAANTIPGGNVTVSGTPTFGAAACTLPSVP